MEKRLNDIVEVVLTCPCGNRLVYKPGTRSAVPLFCASPVCTNRGKSNPDNRRAGHTQTLIETVFALQTMAVKASFEITMNFS